MLVHIEEGLGPLQHLSIVHKGVSTPPPISKSSPSLLGSPLPFPNIPHPPTLPANWPSQIFHINRNATVKLSSINTIHVKQNNILFAFSFTSSL